MIEAKSEGLHKQSKYQERLIMQAELYAREGDTTTPQKPYNPSLCAKNRLNLLPEHIAEIAMAFVEQLSVARLPSRDVRIASSIFYQTIGFNKREDDMNPTRLEQLTDIRDDHASASVHRLKSLNIIITRRGSYGKWLSINYDFRNWGEPSSESTTNDPSCLLSDGYQDQFDDEALEFKLHTPPDSVSKARKKEQTAVASKAVSEVIRKEEKVEPIVQPDPLPEERPSLPTTESINTSKPLIAQQPPEKPVEKPLTPTIEAKQKIAELHFPKSIPDKLRQQITEQLEGYNVTKTMQQLVDYFGKCLLSGKVRSPIAYFRGLKERWLNNSLELNQTPDQMSNQTQIQPQYATEAENKAKRQQTENRHAYQEAVADILHMKKLLKIMMDQKNTTFEQVLKEMNYTQVWKKAVECLKQTREACLSQAT